MGLLTFVRFEGWFVWAVLISWFTFSIQICPKCKSIRAYILCKVLSTTGTKCPVISRKQIYSCNCMLSLFCERQRSVLTLCARGHGFESCIDHSLGSDMTSNWLSHVLVYQCLWCASKRHHTPQWLYVEWMFNTMKKYTERVTLLMETNI